MQKICKLITFIALLFALFGLFKSLPEGVNTEGNVHLIPDKNVTFLKDVTYIDQNDVRISEQEIFDEVFLMIDEAERYVLIDMFLFNDFLGTATSSYRSLSSELTNILLDKKAEIPGIDIVFITDPINGIYGGYDSEQLRTLKDAGVEVVVTDLLQLRDSNPLYSGFYRAYFRWFGNSPEEGKLANVFDTRLQKLGLRTYSSLLNFKANHRKVVLVDSGNTFSVLVTSANPHDGSSAHTNIALRVDGFLWKEVLESEMAVADFSEKIVSEPSEDFVSSISDKAGDLEVQLLTEKKIRDTLLEEIDSLGVGSSIDMVMFYLSDRKIIKALKRADKNGVYIRILLDPNKDAFGRKKNGIPNRSVAHELNENSDGNTIIRFCNTRGEQCHSKMVLLNNGIEDTMILGSANLTRRNLGNFNLETNILVRGVNSTAIYEAREYFEKVWNNKDGKIYSVDYESFRDESVIKTVMYRFMEGLGTSSF